MKNEKLCIYGTNEVMKVELDAVYEKYGDTEEANKFVDEKISEFISEEMDSVKEDLANDRRDDRLEYTIEKENGEIWICLKLFNIKRFQQKFGTEP